MNRRLTFAIGAIQALSAVAIGIGAIAVPLSILWIFEWLRLVDSSSSSSV